MSFIVIFAVRRATRGEDLSRKIENDSVVSETLRCLALLTTKSLHDEHSKLEIRSTVKHVSTTTSSDIL